MERAPGGDPVLDHGNTFCIDDIQHIQDSVMGISNREAIDLNGKSVAVIGAGRSGLSATRLLTELGAKVFVSEAGKNIDVDELKNQFSDYFKLFEWQKKITCGVGADLGCGSGRWAKFVSVLE